MAQKRKVIFYLVAAIILLLLITVFYLYREKFSHIIVPFFMALIIAYLINPLVIRLERKKIPRMAGILLIYLLAVLTIISLMIFMVPELIKNTKELITTIPSITSRYQDMFNWTMSMIKSSNWPDDIKNTVFREVQNGAVIVQDYIIDNLKKALTALIETVSMLFDFVLSMIIAYYFVKDAEFFKEAALSLTPRRWRNGITGTGREVHQILSHFIQGQLLAAMIIGILEMIGLSLIRVKYPLVLGLVGGIANIIPYFGPIIGAVPAVAIALLDSPLRAVWVVIVFVIIQQIDNAFISPKIIEGKLGLHPVTTILAVLVGGEFFGLVGLLVAVPITAVIRVIIKRSVEAIV